MGEAGRMFYQQEPRCQGFELLLALDRREISPTSDLASSLREGGMRYQKMPSGSAGGDGEGQGHRSDR